MAQQTQGSYKHTAGKHASGLGKILFERKNKVEL